MNADLFDFAEKESGTFKVGNSESVFGAAYTTSPLAEFLRPDELSDLYGQDQIIKSGVFRNFLADGLSLPNLILWGPPGTGKTSFALLMASRVKAKVYNLSAISLGAKELRELGEEARSNRKIYQRRTLVFIDEIHRLNKAQQDVLLPYIERGDFSLIGATTENPSYELNRALLSRSQILVFQALNQEALKRVFFRAFAKKGLMDPGVYLSEEVVDYLINFADGDARRLLNLLDTLWRAFHGHFFSESILSEPKLDQVERVKLHTADLLNLNLGERFLGYDKNSDHHYDCISALIKSVRGSDVDASLYWLCRMLEAGESATFIARRLIILASEDIGNADPRGLQMAVAAADAVEMIGMPEAGICLSQVVTYLASAPKSNRSYLAFKRALEFVKTTGTRPVPLALRSARTKSMQDLGYGKSYRYPHDFAKSWVKQNYWPDNLDSKPVFYEPSERGFEKMIRDFLVWLKS